MAPRPTDRHRPHPGARDERKSRTRRALLDAALERLSGEQSFSSLSLREVAKDAGVVPGALYRHFPGMEALGLTLVEESFVTLRGLMREVRSAPIPPSHVVRRSVETFLDYVFEHQLHFRFIAKERYGGSSIMRMAIRQEIRLFTSELATDLARMPNLTTVSSSDLQLISGLVVQTIIGAAELALDSRREDPTELVRIADEAERQLRIILLGAAAWRSDLGDAKSLDSVELT
jgi:AcrR family transcriptional regulator